MKPYQPNESILSAFDCLQAISTLKAPASVQELSQTLNKEYTHTHRVLRTLLHLGIVAQTSDKKYVAGYGLYMLCAQSLYNSQLLEKSNKILQSYVRENLIIAVGIFFREHVWYIAHTEPGRAMASAQDVILYDAKKSTIALCLSAFMPDEALIAYFQTQKNIQLRAQIKKDGYFFTQTEFGEHSIAFPIFPLKPVGKAQNLGVSQMQHYLANKTPIAGLAFVDTSASQNRAQMVSVYAPAAIEFCRSLYHTGKTLDALPGESFRKSVTPKA